MIWAARLKRGCNPVPRRPGAGAEFQCQCLECQRPPNGWVCVLRRSWIDIKLLVDIDVEDFVKYSSVFKFVDVNNVESQHDGEDFLFIVKIVFQLSDHHHI